MKRKLNEVEKEWERLGKERERLRKKIKEYDVDESDDVDYEGHPRHNSTARSGRRNSIRESLRRMSFDVCCSRRNDK